MKIAILSFYSGHVERGVENWTYEIASRLAKNNAVTVFQNEEVKIPVIYKIVTSNIKVNWKSKDASGTLGRKFFIDYWSILIARFTLSNILKLVSNKPDVIIPTNGGWQTFLCRIYTLVFGKKLVLVSHSGKGWDERFNNYNFPNLFVALTPKLAKWVKKINPFIKVVNIPNGIDLNNFSIEGDKVVTSLHHPIYLVVAAATKDKRIDLAIEAVSRLSKGSLLVLGGGLLEKELKSMGKQKLGKRFLMKRVNYADIPKYYRAADAFTLVSAESEAFGMVYLEAMACGLPVVATDDETRRYVVGDAGILVDPTDIQKYSKAMKKAASMDWGDKPLKQAQKFSWDKIACLYEAELLELIKK